MREFAPELESGLDWEKIAERCRTLIAYWIARQGKRDLIDYDIVSIEEDVHVLVPGLKGFYFTGRVDALLRSKQTKLLTVRETKTSSFSVMITEDALRAGDQVTAYYWLVKARWKEEPWGVEPDIAYWSKTSQDPSKIQIYVGSPVTRTSEDIATFQAEIAQMFSEIAQKVSAYEKGRSPRGLFRRNTHYCMAFGKRCEYFDICRERRLTDGYVPPGFRLEAKRPIQAIADETWDSSLES